MSCCRREKKERKKPSDWRAGLAVSAANCPDDCFYVTSLRLPLAAALVFIDSLSLLNFFPPRSRGAKKSLAGLCGGGLSGQPAVSENLPQRCCAKVSLSPLFTASSWKGWIFFQTDALLNLPPVWKGTETRGRSQYLAGGAAIHLVETSVPSLTSQGADFQEGKRMDQMEFSGRFS